MYVPQIPSSLRILLIVFLFCNSYASDVHADLTNRSGGDSKTDQKKGGTASSAGDKKAGSSSSAPKGSAGSDGSKPVDGNKNASSNSPTSGHEKSSDNMTPENVRKASLGNTSKQSDSLMDRGDTGTQEVNQTSTQRDGGTSHREKDEVLDSGHRDEDSFSRLDDVSDAGDSSRDLAGAGAELGGAVIGAKSARNQAVIAAEAEKEAAEIEREAAREQAEIAADASLGEAEIAADASLEEAEIAADSALDEALVAGGLGVAGTVADNVSSREGGGSDNSEGGSEQDQEDSDTEDGSGDDYGDDGYESGEDEDGMGGGGASLDADAGGATASNALGKIGEEGTSPASESERQALAAKGLKGTSVGTGSGEGGARAKAKKGGGATKLKPGTMTLVIQGAKGTKPQIKALPKGTRAVCFTVTPGVQGKAPPKAAKKSATRVLKSRSLEMKKVRASERLSRDLDKLGAQTEAIEKALDALQAEVQRLAASPKL